MLITDIESLTDSINVIGLLEAEGFTKDLVGARCESRGQYDTANEVLGEISRYKDFFKSQYEYEATWKMVNAIRFITTNSENRPGSEN